MCHLAHSESFYEIIVFSQNNDNNNDIYNSINKIDISTIKRRLNDTKGVIKTCVDEVKQAVSDAETPAAVELKKKLIELEELNNHFISVNFD